MSTLATLLRSCGRCRACCTPLAIEELQKPPGVPCKHLAPEHSAGGCSIYAERPRSCAEYHCGWRTGTGAPTDRPDICGVLFSSIANTDTAIAEVPGLLPFSYLANEVWPGAFAAEPGAALIADMAGSGVIIFAVYGERSERCRVVGPVEIVTAAMHWCRANHESTGGGADLMAILGPGFVRVRS